MTVMLRTNRCLGVDFGGEDIKAVEMRRLGKTYEILQAARIPVAVGDGATALGHFLLETATYPANVVCSLPSNVCSVKFAEVPRAKRAELARMVRFEAESQIPLPLSEMVWDFTAEGARSDPTLSVVIAAARKSTVDEVVSAMDAAHAHPSQVTVSLLAGSKAVAPTGEEPVLIVDIGSAWTDMCVVGGCAVLASRSVKCGAGDLTDAFAHDFKADPDEAERLKRTRGVNLDVRLAASDAASDESSIEKWVDKMSDEIRRSALSMNGNGSRRPQRAMLIGGIAGLPGLAESLARRTGMMVDVGNPWDGMRLSQVCSHTLREAPAAFAVATGLAMMGLDGRQSINLTPRRLAEERAVKRREVGAVAVMGALAIALLFSLVAGAHSLKEKSAELTGLKLEVKSLQRRVRLAGPSVRTEAGAVTAMVKCIQSKDTSCLELLRRLSESLPRSVWLSEMSFENGENVVLKGGSLSNSSVADAVDSLVQLETFESVTLDYSNLGRGEAGQTYDFQITCALPPSRNGEPRFTSVRTGKAGARPRMGIIVQ